MFSFLPLLIKISGYANDSLAYHYHVKLLLKNMDIFCNKNPSELWNFLMTLFRKRYFRNYTP